MMSYAADREVALDWPVARFASREVPAPARGEGKKKARV
jgi:hypothetical protein